jgi:hypothetical protein
MMLRTLALGMVGANLLFLAWTQGWLGSAAPVPPALQGREPDRLQQQVRPDTVTVLRPRAAAALAAQGTGAPPAPGAGASAPAPAGTR